MDDLESSAAPAFNFSAPASAADQHAGTSESSAPVITFVAPASAPFIFGATPSGFEDKSSGSVNKSSAPGGAGGESVKKSSAPCSTAKSKAPEAEAILAQFGPKEKEGGDDDLDFSIECLASALAYPEPAHNDTRHSQAYLHAFTPVWEFSVVPHWYREAIAKATKLKEAGNAALKAKRERDSIIIYNAAKALIVERSAEGTALLATLHANLAKAFLDYAQSPNNSFLNSEADSIDPSMIALSVAESTQALELDPNHQKARYRRAVALVLLGCYENAMTDLENCKPTVVVVKRRQNLREIIQAGAPTADWLEGIKQEYDDLRERLRTKQLSREELYASHYDVGMFLRFYSCLDSTTEAIDRLKEAVADLTKLAGGNTGDTWGWFTDKVLRLVVESWHPLRREQLLTNFFIKANTSPGIHHDYHGPAVLTYLGSLFLPHKCEREVAHNAEYKHWHQHYQAELHRLGSGRATRMVALRGLEYPPDEAEALLQALSTECSKSGALISIELQQPTSASDDAVGGGSSALIEYERAESAYRCINAICGRKSCAGVEFPRGIVAEYGGGDPRQYGQSWERGDDGGGGAGRAEAEAEAGAGAGAEAEARAGAGAEAEARAGAGAEAEARAGAGAEAEARAGAGAGADRVPELAFPDGQPRAVPFPPEDGLGSSDHGKHDLLMVHAMAIAWFMVKQVRVH
jgi:hypothetical protein